MGHVNSQSLETRVEDSFGRTNFEVTTGANPFDVTSAFGEMWKPQVWVFFWCLIHYFHFIYEGISSTMFISILCERDAQSGWVFVAR